MMQKSLSLALLMAVFILSTIAVHSQLLCTVPDEWSLAEDLCIHQVCGHYTDSRSGAIVSVSFRGLEDYPTWYPIPTPADPTIGVTGQVLYAYFFFQNPREWQKWNYLQHVVLFENEDPFENVIFSPEGSTWLHMRVLTPMGLWSFNSDACNDLQLLRARAFMRQQLVLLAAETE